MATPLYTFLTERHRVPIVFAHEGRIGWTNGTMLVMDDPQLTKRIFLDADVLEGKAYELTRKNKKFMLGEESCRFNDCKKHITRDLATLRPAYLSTCAEFRGTAAQGIYFGTPIETWNSEMPELQGAYFSGKQFNYLARIASTDLRHDERGFLYFMHNDRIRGSTTYLNYIDPDSLKLHDKLVAPANYQRAAPFWTPVSGNIDEDDLPF
jgi:hypothetical protein